MKNVDTININLLKPHPRNKDIYGEENIKELAEKIRQSGYIKPILINQNNIIISGHRRYYACLELNKKFVPFEKSEFENENDELERLLLENEYREKSNFQKAQEGKLWEEIIVEKAKLRQKATQFGSTVGDRVPQPNEEGRSRDIIADKVGMGSGRSYERAKYVSNKIEELKTEENTKDTEFLTIMLNESVRGTYDILKAGCLNNISDETKNKVINKELPVLSAIKEIKKEFGISNTKVKTEQQNSEKIPKLETKICSKCGKELPLYEFYEGKGYCKDCHNSQTNKRFKDVYGNNMTVDYEKIKGIDIEGILQGVKNTDKSISEVDYDAFSMEFQCNISMFIQNISKYIDMEDMYKLNDIDKDNKNKVLTIIEELENTINKIKNIIL